MPGVVTRMHATGSPQSSIALGVFQSDEGEAQMVLRTAVQQDYQSAAFRSKYHKCVQYLLSPIQIPLHLVTWPVEDLWASEGVRVDTVFNYSVRYPRSTINASAKWPEPRPKNSYGRFLQCFYHCAPLKQMMRIATFVQ